jgi:carbamoyltransferase
LQFYRDTNCPVLINTSFNIRGEPIVLSPEDAFKCFINTNIDTLVIDKFLIHKSEQKINFDFLKYSTIELSGASHAIKIDKIAMQSSEIKKEIISLCISINLISLVILPFFKKILPYYETLALPIILLPLAFYFPSSLYYLAFAWKITIQFIGKTKSSIALFLSYFFLLAPYGLILRLFVKSNIGLKKSKSLESYFIKS